jgi:exodeoxyribonuclease-3
VTRFATWNVNSLNARQQRVEEWLADVQPDILCMQETKLSDEAFPALTFEAMGYESVHHGEGRWNGVAILSRVGLDDVVMNFADGADPDAEARVVTARCGAITVVDVYVPNGRALGHDHYRYKLGWLARLGKHVDAVSNPGDPVIIAGDFNIAPGDIDVYDPAAFVGATHTSQPERDALVDIIGRGFDDVLRTCHPAAASVYSWWDYRRGDFHEGRGLRIDLVLATKPVSERVEWCVIDRNARKGTQPSDHAPVVVDLRD